MKSSRQTCGPTPVTHLSATWGRNMRIRKRLVCGGLLAWIVVIALFVTSTPTAPSGKSISADFSGRYVCSRMGGSGEAKIGYPFVAFDMMREGTEIAVTQDSTRSVTFVYHWTNGFWKTNAISLATTGDFSWRDGCLTYFKRTWRMCGILPGLELRVEDSRMRRNEHGDLEIRYLQTRKGLALFLLPFSEALQSTLRLDRVEEPPGPGRD